MKPSSLNQGNASSVVTHYPEIPRSLMPVVVTDASAKVNASYSQMARSVPVSWLADAPKTYRNLTLRIVPTAASRSVYRDTKANRGRDLLDMAARYIASVPAGQDVLVVGYKGRFRLKGVVADTLDKALLERLKPEDRDRVRYLDYGKHTSTNAYRNVRHVMLLGLNFLPRAASHAASGAALDYDLKSNHPTEDQIRAMHEGMLLDTTMQALLRGNARMGVDGGDCGEMEAIIPQTRQTGIPEDGYRLMFPGATIVADRLLMPSVPLKGRLGQLAGIVARRLQAGERELDNPSLYGEMSISKQQFTALVKLPAWQAHVAACGWRPQRLPGRTAGLHLIG